MCAFTRFNFIEVIEGMKRARRQHVNKVIGGDMESLDVHDLPEDEAEIVAAFRVPETAPTPAGIPASPRPRREPLASWPLGAKGTLSREDIYEHLE